VDCLSNIGDGRGDPRIFRPARSIDIMTFAVRGVSDRRVLPAKQHESQPHDWDERHRRDPCPPGKEGRSRPSGKSPGFQECGDSRYG